MSAPWEHTRCYKCGAAGSRPAYRWPAGGDGGFSETNPVSQLCAGCEAERTEKEEYRAKKLELLERLLYAVVALAPR